MAARILVALVWHMHQPSYRDPATGRFVLPWTRLHATKDYGDMVAALAPYPGVHATFSLTPVLLDQLEAIAGGGPEGEDPHLATARLAPEDLTREQRDFLLREFFHVHRTRMLDPHPRYRELWKRAEEERRGGASLTAAELRDLQTWFHLAWVDPTYRDEEPIRSLMEQGSGFREDQKAALLDWGVALASRIVSIYRDALERGQVELATVPYHHPILPLLCDTDAPREVSATIPLPAPRARAPEDAAAQVREARASHERRFGAPPRGVWPAEGAVSRDAVDLLAREGFAWAASDEETLRRALAAAGDRRAEDPAARLQAWSVAPGPDSGSERGSAPLAMLFRDRHLSDLIGFSYMHAEPRAAAADFVARIRETASAWRGEGSPIVTIILDGENCWESYESDGASFLAALYAALQDAPDLAAVTVSEALEAAPPRETLARMPVGSWIRADLGIWVGHAEKNRGWVELHLAREAVRAAERRGVDSTALAAARGSLYAAEASDWFWWYGDDHETSHAEEFDRLFRAHVRRVYETLGLPPSPRLGASLRDPAARKAPPAPYIQPRLDGRDSDYYEWRDAARIDPGSLGGSMHATASLLREIRYGVDEGSLFVRVAPDPAARLEAAILLVEAVGEEGPGAVAAIPFGGDPRGVPPWRGGSTGASGDSDEGGDGAYARDLYVEARLPFARFGVAAGETLAWRLAVERGGRREEVLPRDGSFRVERPHADRRLTHWSAT